ncbi:putative acetate non-utilizing protein mitochondrial [Rosellinia necatrix]|uniref:Putative acetate non-utilizing protein mitochondrial n=1 Tax=Rosellinia necatrix TaxID=77044 RepID=A0A1W2TFV2_ROSNE|nr:putative acetate non-utilizing protein mitochondrial [Rosellinia necatrix]
MPLQIAHPDTALHLYRHLLREATYLPPLCRPWITSRIQQRFRDCRYKKPPNPHIKQAHSSLRYLRSANDGHVKRLERLCFMAAGRIGKRRRILATSQLSSRPSADTAELEASVPGAGAVVEAPPSHVAPNTATNTAINAAINAAPVLSPTHSWLENWSLDMVTAIAQSQVEQQAGDWPHSMRRGLDTKKIVNGTNCFGRPYTPKLVRNKLKKHWAGVFKQLQPPLPQGEWDHLAALVQGEANVEELKIPRRRPVAQSAEGASVDLVTKPWDWAPHVLKPARVIERGASRKLKSLTGKEDQDPRGHGRPIGTRVIGPRRLQRIYGRIWTMSPRIKASPKTQKWSVTWGKNEEKISVPSARDLLFFQGVANDGSVLPKARTASKA